jgi:superfamily II DNA or RNA helicase
LTRAKGRAGRTKELHRIRRKLKNGLSKAESIVVSHDTLCDDAFHQELRKFACKKMIIADEVHNLGRDEFIKNPPDFFEYRLALSATPERQYDKDGTEALIQFFGPSVFQFTLKEAIGTCLVEYDYFVHPVYLTQQEMDDWYEITANIKSNSWRIDSKGPDEYLAKLFRDRRKLLETAENKIRTLDSLLSRENLKHIRHTLIYATDKDPQQLEEVNALLQSKNVLFHQLTSEETKNRDKSQRIIKDFQNGALQILTAKRVLDEGVNIPQINKAFILASTTVERQWTQRRGRLLRTCNEINKNHSVIHDFIALPAGYDELELDEDAKNLIKSELKRVQEFASVARNAGRKNGPLPIIDKMIHALYG